MDKYENLGPVGEGSYGMVLKCRHKETQQIVAVKKFLESEDDTMVKKIAMREVRMLRQLRHENLVNLIEVFRKKKRLYLVFEFVDHTVLDELERCPTGLDESFTKKIIWQVLRGIEFCHQHSIIHRDIKPENILISKSGVVKLCDFGFARLMAQPGETYTDYVATRWYRAPELLVGDTKYGRAVDIWAVGCLVSELLTSEPLFPGESDIDQLYHIIKTLGNLNSRQEEIFYKNPLFVGMKLPEVKSVEPFENRMPAKCSRDAIDAMKKMLALDADRRPTCSEILQHPFFTKDAFDELFLQELRVMILRENEKKPLNRVAANMVADDTASKKKAKKGSHHKEIEMEKHRGYKHSPPKQEKKSEMSMPAISPHMPLINGSSPTLRANNNNSLAKGKGAKQKTKHHAPDLGFRTEKTSLHDKYSPKKTSSGDKGQRSDGIDDRYEQNGLSLPELQRGDGPHNKTKNQKPGIKRSNSPQFATPRTVHSQLSTESHSLPSV
ncbi:cyclin-dependent kinase-like 4 [Watersipora subatra]|uniref:cyclin-dependent kinase-like 4 n=1 Tax=Watersipora subatra TaxID=2589382 RepID=UPI00355B36F0